MLHAVNPAQQQILISNRTKVAACCIVLTRKELKFTHHYARSCATAIEDNYKVLSSWCAKGCTRGVDLACFASRLQTMSRSKDMSHNVVGLQCSKDSTRQQILCSRAGFGACPSTGEPPSKTEDALHRRRPLTVRLTSDRTEGEMALQIKIAVEVRHPQLHEPYVIHSDGHRRLTLHSFCSRRVTPTLSGHANRTSPKTCVQSKTTFAMNIVCFLPTVTSTIKGKC